MSSYPPPPPGDYPPAPDVPPPPGGGDALAPRGLGEILGGAFEIYRRNAQSLITIVAIIVVPLAVLSYLLTDVLFAVRTTSVVVGTSTVDVAEPRSFGVFLLAVLAAAAISVIITAVLQAAILRAAAQATMGDPVDVEASYKWGLSRFPSVLLVSFLVGISVAVGFVLLVVPGIILLVMFAVSVPVLVVENLRGTGAMRRSWALVSHHFWHVLGVIVVAAILTGIVSAIISAFGGGNTVLGLIFSTIAQIIVAPYTALVSVLLYLDLRARSESLSASRLRGELGTV